MYFLFGFLQWLKLRANNDIIASFKAFNNWLILFWITIECFKICHWKPEVIADISKITCKIIHNFICGGQFLLKNHSGSISFSNKHWVSNICMVWLSSNFEVSKEVLISRTYEIAVLLLDHSSVSNQAGSVIRDCKVKLF